MLRRALALIALVACNEAAPRMHVTRKEVPLGAPVIVHLEDALSAPRSGALWLTLAPVEAPDAYVGERVVIDGSATHVTLSTPAPGRWEVRLHDEYPKKPHHLVAKTPIEVVAESASATFMSK